MSLAGIGADKRICNSDSRQMNLGCLVGILRSKFQGKTLRALGDRHTRTAPESPPKPAAQLQDPFLGLHDRLESLYILEATKFIAQVNLVSGVRSLISKTR